MIGASYLSDLEDISNLRLLLYASELVLTRLLAVAALLANFLPLRDALKAIDSILA